MQENKKEALIEWEAGIDMGGPAQPIEQLKSAIEAAPNAVVGTPEYYYYQGFIDGRVLHEELGGV